MNDGLVKNQEDQQRLDACSNANFNHGVLLYQNVLLIFKCTKWDKQFPNLFNSISKTSAASWDQIFKPINEVFLENQQRRNRVFKDIKDLDNKGGLDSLSYVIVALNETNFFDSVKAMFRCAANPGDDSCKERKNIPAKSSLKNIIRLIDLNPNVIGELSELIKNLDWALAPKKEQLRSEVNKFRLVEKYIPLRISLMDTLANKARAGLSNEDRTFLSNILTVGNKNSDEPWIYQWLKDEKLGRIKFRDLMEYPNLINPDAINDLRAVKQLYNVGLSCTYNDLGDKNNSIEFDLNQGIGDYVTVIKSKDYKTFYDFSSMHITGLKTASPFCKELVNNQYRGDLVKIATKVAEFFSEKKNYDLMKFILNYSTSKGEPHKSFEENIYFADFLAGDIFYAANGINGHIATYSRDFFPVVYDLLVAQPPESVLNLANIVSELTLLENDPKFVGIADFWLFFNSVEKNYLFNFIDRHFDKNVEYVLLLDFYSKFLDELKDSQPILKNGWAGSDEKVDLTYLALEDMFNNLSGKDTLQDFKKFFSRDQIIKILEVLSNGQQLADNAKAELKYRDSNRYVLLARAEKYKYKVNYDPTSDDTYDTKAVLQCMQYFSNIQNGFYDLVKNLPEACRAVSSENIAFRVYGWLDFIEHDFQKFKPAVNNKDSLFDDKGILSPYMLNTNIALAKSMDNIVGPWQSSEPTKNGIEYILNSFNFYLNNKKGILVLEKDFNLLSKYLDVNKEDNKVFRNSLLKEFAKNDNFTYSSNVFANVGDLLVEYGNWFRSGQYAKAQSRTLGKYDASLDCFKVINQNISTTACPNKEIVKDFGNKILFYLSNIWEKEEGSPIQLFLHALKTGEGLDIPLNAQNTHRYRVTLSETLRYLYDTTDRALKVNNQNLLYLDEKNQASLQNVTVLERIETVIREVRFGNNYLGVSYLNHIVEGNDYNKDVNERRLLIRSCVKIPKVRCGRPMSENDLRMAQNAVESFDALADVNNGFGLEPKLHYGEYLKTVQQALVGSSAKDAQALTLLPLSDEVLLKHNGIILSYLTQMNGFSNSARFVRDRIGRTRGDFESFLNREDFKRVDRALLAGFELNLATPSAERLIRKLRTIPSGEKQNLFNTSVDWLSTLSYDELRLVEDTAARLLVVGSYLGNPSFVFNKQYDLKEFDRYQNNNLYLMFMSLEKLADYWPVLKKLFPVDTKFIEVLKPINGFLYFLTDRLNSTSDPTKNKAYKAINDLFYVAQSLILDNVQDGRIYGNKDKNYTGLDFIISALKDSDLVTETYSTIRANYIFSNAFYENQGDFFLGLGQNMKRISLNSKIELSPIREYLNFTSKDAMCIGGDSKCGENYHYDEIATLVKYLNLKDEKGITNLYRMNNKIFQENYSQIIEMINDLVPAIKIKSIQIPLAIN